MYIKKIIIWPKNRANNKRVLNLDSGKIEVFTGESRTGKTALISIIDYVLGASKCRVPVGEIRDYSEWFGLLIESEEEQLLFARKTPQNSKTNTAYYFERGESISVPEIIGEANASVDHIKKILNDYFDYSKLDVDEKSGFGRRPSYRDSISLNFQPQTIIANPNILYYKADSTDHREKLKRVLPYILNIQSNQNLLDIYNLELLEKQKKKFECELVDRNEYLSVYTEKLDSLIFEAMQLGLLNEIVLNVTDLSVKEKIQIINKIKNSSELFFAESNFYESNDLVLAKEKRQNELHFEIMNLRNQCKGIEKELERTRSQISLNKQRVIERIDISEWVINSFKKTSTCDDDLEKYLDKIETTINKYKATNKSIDLVNSVLEVEVLTKKQILREKIQLFNASEKELSSLYLHKTEKDSRSLFEKVTNYKAKLLAEIDFFNSLDDSVLEMKILEITQMIELLKLRTNQGNIAKKEKKVLYEIGTLANSYLRFLDVDDPISTVYLELKDLTISRESQNSGYKDKEYLWEIGSASNWLGYHIAVYLAIHHYLNSLSDNKVLNFLVFDQPSQVYFPEETKKKIESLYVDKDTRNVRKIFEALNNFIESNPNYQIIVLEHAPERIWGNLKFVRTNEKWNEDNKLIPMDWINKEKSDG